MRKIFAMVMVVVLMVSLVSNSFAEDRNGKFDSSLMKVFEKRTSKDWYESSQERALLTVMLALEYQVNVLDAYEIDLGVDSYVAKNGITLAVFIPSEENIVALFFIPIQGSEVEYYEFESTSLDMIKLALERSKNWDWKMNDIEDMLMAFKMLTEIMKESPAGFMIGNSLDTPLQSAYNTIGTECAMIFGGKHQWQN